MPRHGHLVSDHGIVNESPNTAYSNVVVRDPVTNL